MLGSTAWMEVGMHVGQHSYGHAPQRRGFRDNYLVPSTIMRRGEAIVIKRWSQLFDAQLRPPFEALMPRPRRLCFCRASHRLFCVVLSVLGEDIYTNSDSSHF